MLRLSFSDVLLWKHSTNFQWRWIAGIRRESFQIKSWEIFQVYSVLCKKCFSYIVLISWDGGRLEIFFFRRFPDFNNDSLLRSLQQLDHVLYQVSRKPRNFSENLLSQQWGTVHVSRMFFKNEDTNCIINHVWHNLFIFFHQPFVQQIFDGQFYCENKWGGCRELL
jgi:hypothetical protein